MSINVEILGFDVDPDYVDPATKIPRVRTRLKYRETALRQGNIDLKNLTQDQIDHLMENIGGISSLPANEHFVNGRGGWNIPANDDPMFVIRPPVAVAVSNVVEIEKPLEDENPVQGSNDVKPLFAGKHR